METKLVTKERVFEICDQLAAVGEKVTNVAVRTELGGGSMSEIAPLLKEWKSIVKTSTLAQSDIDIPPLPADELAEYLSPWWRQMWRTIYHQANTKIAEVKNQAEEEVEIANAKIVEQVSEINQQQGLIDNLTEDLQDYRALKLEFDKLLKQNHHLETDLATAQYQTDLVQQKLDAQVKEKNRLDGELAAAIASIETVRRTSNDQLNELRESHREGVLQINKQFDLKDKEAKDQIEELNKCVNHAQIEIGRLTNDNENMASQIATLLPLESTNRKLVEDNATAHLKIDELNRALARESENSASLKKMLDDAQTELTSSDRNLTRTETELEQTQLYAETLKEKCSELDEKLRSESATVNRFSAIIEHDADTITQLREEKSRLTKRVDQLIDTVANVSSK